VATLHASAPLRTCLHTSTGSAARACARGHLQCAGGGGRDHGGRDGEVAVALGARAVHLHHGRVRRRAHQQPRAARRLHGPARRARTLRSGRRVLTSRPGSWPMCAVDRRPATRTWRCCWAAAAWGMRASRTECVSMQCTGTLPCSTAGAHATTSAYEQLMGSAPPGTTAMWPVRFPARAPPAAARPDAAVALSGGGAREHAAAADSAASGRPDCCGVQPGSQRLAASKRFATIGAGAAAPCAPAHVRRSLLRSRLDADACIGEDAPVDSASSRCGSQPCTNRRERERRGAKAPTPTAQAPLRLKNPCVFCRRPSM